jgi:hypothetical protein
VKRALLLLALALAAGCAGGGERGPAGPLTAAELDWVDRFLTWDTRYGASNRRLEETYDGYAAGRKDLEDLRVALRPYIECERSLGVDVDDPPTKRLRETFDLLVEACREDAIHAQAMLQEIGGSADEDVTQLSSTAGDILNRAYESIERLLRANRPLPRIGGTSRRSRIEPDFSRVAEEIGLSPVEVRCWSTRDWTATREEWGRYIRDSVELAGFAHDPYRVSIAPEYCRRLVRFVHLGWRPLKDELEVDELADAVALLAHEIEHLSYPAASETETECRAVQDIRPLATGLGASPRYARRLANVYWTRVYPYQPSKYRSRLCRNGGPFDLDPESDVWP